MSSVVTEKFEFIYCDVRKTTRYPSLYVCRFLHGRWQYRLFMSFADSEAM